ncbi:NUDIX hydrolase [Nocardioides jishulii]|uniref:NUDIX domain-containing protein n=1 Tax=Nocardioides jishulii TaxID=2575440 RepID=A0A4U2YS23_9ACTN|nr:NUDIX domain-containing protein [Nocardioides jishulii]QCX26440.1 NUDIX domain-containing protein [Nocardioides jishulii]TKI63754.1 NUDIX domain-containing protein [Nocardioides jishulii]
MASPPPGSSETLPDVIAAGAVVLRKGPVGKDGKRERQVLLVHRPRYDDWSFPKGKLDPGEHLTACATREVLEETGMQVHLGVPLPVQRYRVAGDRMKTVHYWMGRVVGDDDVSRYVANREIDAVEWVDWSQAEQRISYRRDRDILAGAWQHRHSTTPLVVLRHAKALPRKKWEGDDRLRPLLPEGHQQALLLAGVLAAYGVKDVVTSSSTRCLQSVQPYADSSGRTLLPRDVLSEEDATPAGVAALLDEVVRAGRPAVVCSHRPVLPPIFRALGVEPVALDPSGFLVLHQRHGETRATEVHPAVDAGLQVGPRPGR